MFSKTNMILSMKQHWRFWKRFLSLIAFVYILAFVFIYTATVTRTEKEENDIIDNIFKIHPATSPKFQRPSNSENKSIKIDQNFSANQNAKKNGSSYLLGDKFFTDDEFLNLASEQKCSEQLSTKINKVTMLRNTILDPLQFSHSSRDRGESLDFTSDFAKSLCYSSEDSRTNVKTSYHVGTKRTLEVSKIDTAEFKKLQNSRNISTFDITLAVFREEYANAYWTVMDNFDIFHILNDLQIKKCQIIWLDAHPFSSMDQLWSIYFGEPLKIEDFRNQFPEKQSNLIFSPRLLLRYDREKSVFLNPGKPPRLNEFEAFRAQGYKNLNIVVKPKDCSLLRLTIAWRRDYVNHPGNPNGIITRKISNEAEVLSALKSFSNVNVTEIQLEKLTVAQQILQMSKTDIFFAMHGAGHTMTAFMPSGGVVVEIMIQKKEKNYHMRQVAENAGQFHIKHTVPNSAASPDGNSHYVEEKAVKDIINRSMSKLCSG